MLKKPPKNIDVMLMEGSSLGRLGGDEAFPSEQALEHAFIERFKATPGMVLVVCSAQNIAAWLRSIGQPSKQSGPSSSMPMRQRY
jgi:hypothetical protein